MGLMVITSFAENSVHLNFNPHSAVLVKSAVGMLMSTASTKLLFLATLWLLSSLSLVTIASLLTIELGLFSRCATVISSHSHSSHGQDIIHLFAIRNA